MQIAEPGQSKVKEACKQRVVGIDLGTTNSLVAHVADASPEVIGGSRAPGVGTPTASPAGRGSSPVGSTSDEGGPLVPSVVHYAADGVLIGRPAQARAADAPRDTIASVKRLIGRGLKDLGGVRAMLPYELEGDDRAVRILLTSGRLVSPVEVSAEILRELRARAEAALGGPIEGAVITVPAYFDDAQRQATRDAGRIAGLEVMRLLAEPTAAALAYGHDRGSTGTYAVFDLGGGTFDISILKLVDGVFEVKATGGDSAFGGDDLDRALARSMIGDALEAAERRTIGGAVAEARRVKEALSDLAVDRVAFALEAPRPELVCGDGDGVTHRVLVVGHDAVTTICDRRLAGRAADVAAAATPVTCVRCLGNGSVFRRSVTRAHLAGVVRPMLDRHTRKACLRALKDAELGKADLDGVILVGGSTRSPVVRDYVRELFEREPLCDLDPEQVVALGAAVQADVLAGGQHNVTLLDVVPLSLGIEMMGGVVEKLIHRNTTIPTGATQVFTTYADNQTGFDIHVVQGERETADACRSLARFVLRGVPPMMAGMGRVEITFLIDADGLLKVMAKELTTGKEASIEVVPSYGLTDEEVERMLIESFEHA